VKPRATRTADIVASVPELTKRRRSMLRNRFFTAWANRTSGSVAVPKLVPRPAALRTARTTAGLA